MLKTKFSFSIKTVSGILSVLFLFAGCSSRYTVPPTSEQIYPGEVNRHVRWIQADSRRIFHILTSPEGMKSLCPEGTAVSYLSPPPYAAGNLVETRVEHIFKLKWTSQVAQVNANRSIQLTFQDGFFAGGTELWEFHPENNGTSVSHTIFFKPYGFFKRLSWVIKVRRKHDKMVELFFDKLKQTAESVVMRAEQGGEGTPPGRKP